MSKGPIFHNIPFPNLEEFPEAAAALLYGLEAPGCETFGSGA
jgi:hypothetical protein